MKQARSTASSSKRHRVVKFQDQLQAWRRHRKKHDRRELHSGQTSRPPNNELLTTSLTAHTGPGVELASLAEVGTDIITASTTEGTLFHGLPWITCFSLIMGLRRRRKRRKSLLSEIRAMFVKFSLSLSSKIMPDTVCGRTPSAAKVWQLRHALRR